MQVADVIERAMKLSASRSDVWRTLTTEDGLAGWWADRVEVDLRPGGTMRFHFGEKYGIGEAEIEVLEPEHRFAFLWSPFTLEDAADYPDLRTRVEFTLAEERGGTLLTLRETGFASLCRRCSPRALSDNQRGWDEELGHLRTYLKTGVTVVHG